MLEASYQEELSCFVLTDKQISRFKEMAAGICHRSIHPLGRLSGKEKALLSQCEDAVLYLTRQRNRNMESA